MADKPHLSTREKRAWTKKLMEAQEAVEDALTGRNNLMKEAYEAGISYASIESATGIGPQSVRNAINDPGRADEGRKANS